jgi:chromosome segregation ATPase
MAAMEKEANTRRDLHTVNHTHSKLEKDLANTHCNLHAANDIISELEKALANTHHNLHTANRTLSEQEKDLANTHHDLDAADNTISELEKQLIETRFELATLHAAGDTVLQLQKELTKTHGALAATRHEQGNKLTSSCCKAAKLPWPITSCRTGRPVRRGGSSMQSTASLTSPKSSRICKPHHQHLKRGLTLLGTWVLY